MILNSFQLIWLRRHCLPTNFQNMNRQTTGTLEAHTRFRFDFDAKRLFSNNSTTDDTLQLPLPRRNSIDFSKESEDTGKKFENQISDFSLRRSVDFISSRSPKKLILFRFA